MSYLFYQEQALLPLDYTTERQGLTLYLDKQL